MTRWNRTSLVIEDPVAGLFVIHGCTPPVPMHANPWPVAKASGHRSTRRECSVSGEFRAQRRRHTMHRVLRVAMLACSLVVAGCGAPSNRYIPAAAISKHGFAREPAPIFLDTNLG